MFSASHPLLFFDYFRVPHRRVRDATSVLEFLPEHPLHSCRLVTSNGADARSLITLLASDTESPTQRADGYFLGTIPIFGRILRDEVIERWLCRSGRGWEAALPILDARGTHVSSVWLDEAGSIFLPFDPDEVIRNFWSERYHLSSSGTTQSRLRAVSVRAYYRLRPGIPRAWQLTARRIFAHVQSRSTFPHWPIETALHDFYEFLFHRLAEVAGTRVPFLAPWPKPYSWTLVLTHDVETQFGYDNVHAVRRAETARGFRSSWNFVPMRYVVAQAMVRDLHEAGCEIGVHGLYHDGRDLASLRTFKQRLPLMRAYGAQWDAKGFRSPATHRVWEWMPMLPFEYDSSYPDTDPFEPQPGGCCSLLPYFNGHLVELPITLPQDHTLFEILRHSDAELWFEKARHIKARGGMALLITHPDVIIKESLLGAYVQLLEGFATDQEVWRALPMEVAAWWRRRAASSVEFQDGGWQVVGPAAQDGSVMFSPEELEKPLRLP